jgi:FkbM family methyltransferase
MISQTQALPVPALSVPAYRRATLRVIRSLPAGQQLFALRAFRRLCRQAGRVQVGRTYFGARMECELDDLIPSCIYHFGIWEPDISAFIQRWLQPGAVFCDVGANIGYHTLLASQAVGARGTVVAVEPSPAIITKLRRNLALNQVSNVRIVEAACAAEHGTLTLYDGPHGNSGMATTVAAVGGKAQRHVPALPLLEILSTEERERVSLLKIDVEGAEAPILSKLLDDVESYPTDFAVLAELARDFDARVFERFLSKGFRAYGLQNSYDVVEGYLHCQALTQPSLLREPPPEQGDVVFTRAAL